MKIIGRNSLIYWLRIPFAIYTIGFSVITIWILSLIILYSFSSKTNRFISFSNWQESYNKTEKHEIIQFHYPFTKMVLATEKSAEGMMLAFLGLFSICFILITILKLISELSKDDFFTGIAVRYLKILGIGLIIFGIIHIAVDFSTSSKSVDLTLPFIFIISGLLFIFLKEIFAKGRKIQEENDLTI